MNRNASASRRDIIAAACAAAVLAMSSFTTSAFAQAYPSKPIRIIVTASPGSVSDQITRLIAGHMSKSMGQSVVVENLPAAAGVPAVQQLVRAPKDGYTLALLSNNHVVNPSVIKNLPYDTLNDIQPIIILVSTPLVLVTNPNVPAKDLKELLELARAKPGSLTYGSAGNGTVLHLAGVLLTSEGNVDITHVPYKGTSQMVIDNIGGTIDMSFLGVATAQGQIDAGRLRAIGVTTTYRSAMLPNVPTFAEQGLRNYSFDGWMALAGPAGLPRPIVDKINAEVHAIFALKEVQESMAKMGVKSSAGTPEAATQFFDSELEKHTTLVKRGGAKVD